MRGYTEWVNSKGSWLKRAMTLLLCMHTALAAAWAPLCSYGCLQPHGSSAQSHAAHEARSAHETTPEIADETTEQTAHQAASESAAVVCTDCNHQHCSGAHVLGLGPTRIDTAPLAGDASTCTLGIRAYSGPNLTSIERPKWASL